MSKKSYVDRCLNEEILISRLIEVGIHVESDGYFDVEE